MSQYGYVQRKFFTCLGRRHQACCKLSQDVLFRLVLAQITHGQHESNQCGPLPGQIDEASIHKLQLSRRNDQTCYLIACALVIQKCHNGLHDCLGQVNIAPRCCRPQHWAKLLRSAALSSLLLSRALSALKLKKIRRAVSLAQGSQLQGQAHNAFATAHGWLQVPSPNLSQLALEANHANERLVNPKDEEQHDCKFSKQCSCFAYTEKC